MNSSRQTVQYSMHNRWTMNLFLGFCVPILEEICTTFLGKVRAQQCESLIQKIPSNPTLQYERDRPSPQTPVNNTVTIFLPARRHNKSYSSPSDVKSRRI